MKKFYLSLILVLLVKLNFAALTVTITTITDTTCQGTTVALTSSVTGATSSVSYVWLKNNVQVSTTSSYSYAANIAGTDTCVVIATSGSETSTDTLIIVVNPAPAITVMTYTACSGVPFSITPVDGVNGVVPVGTTYSWSIPTGSGLTGFESGTNASNISGTLTNTTNTVKTATLTITPKSAAGCIGPTFVLTITVNPVATITALTTTVCSGNTFSVTPFNSVNGIVPMGTTYSWGAPTATGLTGGTSGTNATNINGILINTTNTSKIATYTVTPLSGSCYGAPFIVTVNVKPTPAIQTMSTTVCSGFIFTVTPTNLANGIIPAGTTYSWPAPVIPGGMTGGAASTNATSIYGTLVNLSSMPQIATYTVTPNSGGCTGASFTVTVTVNPIPMITNMSATVCSGNTFTVTPVDGTTGVIPAGTTYSWVAPVVTGNMSGGTSGSGTSITGTITNPTNTAQTATYTVIPSAGGCTGSPFNVTVTVKPAPIAPIVNSPISYCLGTTAAQLTATGTNLLWYTTATGGTGSSTPPTPSTATLGTTYYYVSQTANGCESPRAEIIVTVSSTAEAPIVTNIAYCQYTTSAPLTAIANGTLLWYSTATGGTGSANAPIPPTMVVGSIYYYVSQTINGCASPRDTIIVFIYPTPSAPIVSNPSAYCEGTTAVQLAATGNNLLWYTTPTGGVGSTITPTPSTIVTGVTNYYVSQSINGCEGQRAEITVTVNTTPVISNYTVTGYSGVPFVVMPTGVETGSTYSWSAPSVTTGITGGTSGSGANISGVLINLTDTFQTAIYIVTPTSAEGCVGYTFTVTIVMNPAAGVPAIMNMYDTVCNGTAFTIIPLNGVNGYIPAGTTYSWTDMNGTHNAQSNINGIFNNATTTVQTATLTITPTSGTGLVGAPFEVYVTVLPVSNILNISINACSGVPFSITPVDGVNGVVPVGTTYSWVDQNGTHTGQSSINGTLLNATTTVQTATLTVTPTSGSCVGATFTVTVTVNAAPIAPIVNSPISYCLGTTAAQLTATGNNLLWYTTPTGGVGSTITPTPSTIVTGVTNYYVSQSINGCESPRAVIVTTVNIAPSITNIIDTVCNNGLFTITPINGVNGVVPAGTTYSWLIPTSSGINGFQAGNNATNISGVLSNNPNSVSHTATYIVTPKLGSCVGDTFTVNVVITTSNAPLATGIIYGPDPVCQGQGPLQYLIVPLINATSYVWTLPIGVIGSSTNNNILVSFSTSIHSATIKVKGYNSYGGFGGEAILVVDVQDCFDVGVFTGDGGISISPNPVSGFSNLKIKLTTDQQLNICIYDITGRKVKEVLNAQKQRGEHHIPIDATELKAGIYLIKAIGEESFETVKFTVVH